MAAHQNTPYRGPTSWPFNIHPLRQSFPRSISRSSRSSPLLSTVTETSPYSSQPQFQRLDDDDEAMSELEKSEFTRTPQASLKFLSAPTAAIIPIKEESFRERVDDRRPTTYAPSTRARPGLARKLCLHWLTAYRILIAVTVVANVIVGGLMIRTRLAPGGLLAATAANLLVSVLGRQEDLINLSFKLIAKVPSTLPLGVRKIIADFHHYGGVHIGCAFASLFWYGIFIGVNTCDTIRVNKAGSMTLWHWIDITTCYVFVVCLAVICLMAIPRLRERLHNSFELTHRFGGWLALAVLWTNTGIRTRLDNLHNAPLYAAPSLWLLAATTFFIILPWLRMRRVPIKGQIISPREIKLTFPYADMPYTSTAKFSSNKLLEWHAFATIPSEDGFTADVLISAAGDWTKNIIANTPSHLYIRTPPAANFLAATPIFNSILLVATGAGIGPMLSLYKSPAVAKMKAEGKTVRVMWSVKDPYAPKWREVVALIKSVDPMPQIFDSNKGRAEIAFEARHMAQTYELEAVMIVANKKVTDETVREVQAHGGAAYGAVFDS